MDVDIEVKMHDVSAWKVNTTSFTLKVYAKDTTYCEYRTYPPECGTRYNGKKISPRLKFSVLVVKQRTYFSYTKFYDLPKPI